MDNFVRLYRLLPDGSLWGVLPVFLQFVYAAEGGPEDGLLGSEAVDGDIIDEDDPAVGLADGFVHGAEDLRFRLGHVHLLREEEAVEMVFEAIGAVDEVEMEVIAVAEQIDLMSRRA